MAYRACFDEKREFGIELEGFGFSRFEIFNALREERISCYISDGWDKESQGWGVLTDGTIQQDQPLEFVSPVFSGEKSFYKIRRLCNVLNEMGIRVDESCGFHIHWNVSDYTGRSVINLLKLYAKYEKILDFIFSESRRENGNEFCRSLVKENGTAWILRLNHPNYFHAFQIAREFEATQVTENKTSFPTARHHKVNVCAYNKYRTIEFRQHEGAFDFEQIKAWIVLSQQLVNRAKDTLVLEGIATWDSFMKTLALSEPQLSEWMEIPNKEILRDTRDFYRKIYRKNKEEKIYVANMGS